MTGVQTCALPIYFALLRRDAGAVLMQENGFWYRLKAVLRAQVHVHRVNTPEMGDTPPRTTEPAVMLEEAASALARGQVGVAIESVSALPMGQAAFAAWLSDAKRYQESMDAIARLEANLLAAMTEQPVQHGTNDAGAETPSLDQD